MTTLILLLSLGPIPAADGTFTGCYALSGPAKGVLRVIDAAGTCRPNEKRTTWNQRGQPGSEALRAAQQRWYPVNVSGAAFPVGNDPMALVFDGASMWVANHADGTVTKLRASDGQSLGTYPVGNGPIALAFDGANVWVANSGDGSVTKLRASDGQGLGTYPVGFYPSAVAFDGEHLWVGGLGYPVAHAPLIKMRTSDGSTVASHALTGACGGPLPHRVRDLVADGEAVWALTTCAGDYTVLMKVLAANGSVVATRSFNENSGMVFDGTSLWVASWHFPPAVWKLRAGDLSVACSYTPPATPPSQATYIHAVAFDGLHVWVDEDQGSSIQDFVVELDTASCAVVRRREALLTDVNAFDGVNVWTVCEWSASAHTVCKR